MKKILIISSAIVLINFACLEGVYKDKGKGKYKKLETLFDHLQVNDITKKDVTLPLISNDKPPEHSQYFITERNERKRLKSHIKPTGTSNLSKSSQNNQPRAFRFLTQNNNDSNNLISYKKCYTSPKSTDHLTLFERLNLTDTTLENKKLSGKKKKNKNTYFPEIAILLPKPRKKK
ncbi:hypothetical protein HOB95_00655 [bacterium]|nr:hypothetical protein [bacterium]